MNRKRIWISVGVFLAANAFAQGLQTKAVERPRVEACFVLDTTGSMGGLIAGAKAKIWSIANDMTNAEPSPELKIGPVAYRDRGDQYVVKRFNLTDDLDAVYDNLMGYQAAGGGDRPESVNQALHEAVQNFGWSNDENTLKVIFLVGDCPPHMDYQDDVKYPKTCQKAVRQGIIINTVQCGNDRATTPIWQEIARLSEGSYVAIAQQGGMAAIATPVDARIAELSQAINRTVIAYGSARQQAIARGKVAAADAAPATSTAARSTYFARGSAGKAISGNEDLVANVAERAITIDQVKASKLPAEYQGLDKEQLAELVEEKQAERQKLQAEMKKLVAERADYVKKALAERKAAGKADGFDDNVRRMLQHQGAKKGIRYKTD